MLDYKKLYKSEIVKKLIEQFNYESRMQAPKVCKITLNMGVGEAVTDKKTITAAIEDLTKIAGLKPVTTVAKKSVAGFKIREGWPIGCKVTLRKDAMYNFLQRLVCIAIPRIRDFRGFSVKGFDGRGNYSLGISEQIIFPEIDYDKIDAIRGMDIAITTSANSDEEAQALLSLFDFPFSGIVNKQQEQGK